MKKINGNTIVKMYDTHKDVAVKDAMQIQYEGETYLYCNTFGPSNVEGYGSVYRSTCSFYKLSPDGRELTFVRSKFIPEGIHYPTFYVERQGFPCRGERLYIIYSTDSRRLDPSEGRSNIALEQIVMP